MSALAGKLQDDLAALCRVDLDGGIAPYGTTTADATLPRSRGDAVGERVLAAAADAATASERGTSVGGIVEACLASIAGSEADVRAWLSIDDEGARVQARALDRADGAGLPHGPLHGVPIGVKDMIDVAGLATTAASRQLTAPGRERIPTADAGIVAVLREAGAVIVGKTNTHEYAFGGTTPPTCNPRDRSRTAGGSSGGSAAAVAAGHVRIALGTDTVGSVRIPSSYCGIAGWLPSPDRIPSGGVLPLAWSLDRVGFCAASAADLVRVARALDVAPPAEGSPITARPLRIGVPLGVFDEPIDGGVRIAVSAAIERIERRGAQIVPVLLPHAWAAPALGITITMAESYDYHRARYVDSPELFSEGLRSWLGSAAALPAGDYVRAQRVRQTLRQEMLAALAQADFIVTPTMPCVAPRWATLETKKIEVGGVPISITEAHLRYTAMANLAGLPVATQPCGTDEAGLPVGLQWIAGPGRDADLLTAVAANESNLPPAEAGGMWTEEL